MHFNRDAAENEDILCLKLGPVAARAAEDTVATETVNPHLGDNDPFSSNVEADLEKNEAVTEDE